MSAEREELGSADGAAFFDTRADVLGAQPDAPSEPPANIDGRKNHEAIQDLQTAREQRRRIVTFTLRTVSGLLIAATVCMGLYMWSQWHAIDSKVVIAYFTSVVVETIGVLYVITRNLFPNGAKNGDEK